MKRINGLFLTASCMISLSLANEPEQRAITESSSNEDLFITAKVWKIHLGFTAENWEAMDPMKVEGTEFGRGGFLSPTFIADGDSDGDYMLSKAEFKALGIKWFNEWRDGNSDPLDKEQIGFGFGSASYKVNKGGFNLRGARGERNGIISVLGLEFPESTTELDFNNTPFESTSIRFKGNGTYMNAMGTQKLPFKIDLNDGYPGRDLAGVVKLNLHNCITDPSYMNEVIAHQLFRDAGVPAPRTSYARVHVSVTGTYDEEYFGLYSIVENVDKQFIEDRYGTRKGAILKPVTPSLFEDLGDQWEAYEQIYDPKTELSEEEKWRLIDLCRLVTHSSEYEFSSRIGNFIDLDEAARYLAVTVLISDLDGILGPGQNFYLYLGPKSNKFIFIPWDQDHSFGQWTRTQEERENLSLNKPWGGENVFLERLFSVPEFKDSYVSHIRVIHDSLFLPERISAQVDELAEVLRPAIRDDSPENLELFNRLVSMDSHHSYANILPERKPDDPRPSPGSFGSDREAKPIKGFVAARTISIEDQLAGRSEGMDDIHPEAEETSRPYSWWGANLFIAEMDADNDEKLSEQEFQEGFDTWFSTWIQDTPGALSEKEIKIGISRAISAMQEAAGGS